MKEVPPLVGGEVLQHSFPVTKEKGITEIDMDWNLKANKIWGLLFWYWIPVARVTLNVPWKGQLNMEQSKFSPLICCFQKKRLFSSENRQWRGLVREKYSKKTKLF